MLKAVVICAALFTAPSWYQTLVLHESAMQPVFARFVIALPVAYALLLILKTVATPAPGGQSAADPGRVARELAVMEQQMQQAPELPHGQPGPEPGQMTTTENNPVP
jgi:hypothetical protein